MMKSAGFRLLIGSASKCYPLTDTRHLNMSYSYHQDPCSILWEVNENAEKCLAMAKRKDFLNPSLSSVYAPKVNMVYSGPRHILRLGFMEIHSVVFVKPASLTN